MEYWGGDSPWERRGKITCEGFTIHSWSPPISWHLSGKNFRKPTNFGQTMTCLRIWLWLDTTYFINLTSPLPASRQRSRATKNSSRAVLYQTFKQQLFGRNWCTGQWALSSWMIWKSSFFEGFYLFFCCLHAIRHFQLSALLGDHVHLHETERSEKAG